MVYHIISIMEGPVPRVALGHVVVVAARVDSVLLVGVDRVGVRLAAVGQLVVILAVRLEQRGGGACDELELVGYLSSMMSRQNESARPRKGGHDRQTGPACARAPSDEPVHEVLALGLVHLQWVRDVRLALGPRRRAST